MITDEVGTCNNPGGCAPAGELCLGKGTHKCCPTGKEGRLRCQETILGVHRCFGDAEECIEEGAACAIADECCPCPEDVRPRCAPVEVGGADQCLCECVERYAPCTANSDCCVEECPLHCMDGICDEPDVCCVPIGGECEEDADCCNGDCFEGICGGII